MVNLGSGTQPHDTAGSGFWDDYFQLRQDASLGFLIDVAVGTTAPRLSGYPTQSAKVTASADVFFGSYDASGFAAYGVARTAAADRFGATSGVSLTARANGAFNPVTADALGLYPGAPAGFTRYLLLGDFQADTLYNISGYAGCALEQTSYFLGDRATGGCTARMLWAGLLYAAPLGGGDGSVDVSLVSPYTGVDWARPYMKSQRPDLFPLTTRPPFGRTTAMNDPAGLAAAVPEPANWAMMIAGFGMVGGMARRRAQRAAALA